MIKKNWIKKSTAIAAAAILGISSSATAAFAADTYQSVEKTALAETAANLAGAYANSLKATEELMGGNGADMTLTLDENGKAMLGAMLGMDLSWADQVKMTMSATIGDGKEAVATDIYLNDTRLCTINTYMDMSTGDTYVSMPDFADGYMKTNMYTTTETLEDTIDAAETEGSEGAAEAGEAAAEIAESASPEQMMAMMNLVTKATEIMPDSSIVEDTINKYGNILIEGTTDAEGSAETLTAEGISQDCTVYEGQLTQDAAVEAVTNILNTAKEDEQLKNVIDTWSAALPDSQDLYQDFLDGIEDTLEDIKSGEATSEDDPLISKVWVGEDGKVVGRQISIASVSDTPLFTYQMPRVDGTYGYVLEIGEDDETVSMTGSGTYADAKMDGTFRISVNSVEGIAVEMTDYDTASMKEGYLNGSYTFTILPGMLDGDEETYNTLKDFALTLNSQSAGVEGNMELGLTYTGVPLATLTTTSGKGEAVEYPDFSTMENVYDAEDEQAMTTYMGNFDYGTLLTNLTAAGVPEELLNSLLGIPTEEAQTDAGAGTQADAAAEGTTDDVTAEAAQ